MAASRRLRGAFRATLRAALHPGTLWRTLRTPARTNGDKVRVDPQLKLYADILRNDMLHYGYFEDPDVDGEEVGIGAIERAQIAYAERIVDAVADRERPVLDIGCGMGGIANLLSRSGLRVHALTPNDGQIRHIRRRYPRLEAIHARFEDYDGADGPCFGTVINAESLQYLRIGESLAVLDRIAAPGARWIVCDYFRKGPSLEKSGHRWDEFAADAKRAGWRLVRREDITRNVLPTLDFVHTFATRLGRPLYGYLTRRLAIRRPRLAYLLRDFLSQADAVVEEQLEIVNPRRFAEEKAYIFAILER